MSNGLTFLPYIRTGFTLFYQITYKKHESGSYKSRCLLYFFYLKNVNFYFRDWSGWTAEEFMARLDAWMRFYSERRLRAFDDGEGRYYDTIDNRRRRLGLAA